MRCTGSRIQAVAPGLQPDRGRVIIVWTVTGTGVGNTEQMQTQTTILTTPGTRHPVRIVAGTPYEVGREDLVDVPVTRMVVAEADL